MMTDASAGSVSFASQDDDVVDDEVDDVEADTEELAEPVKAERKPKRRRLGARKPKAGKPKKTQRAKASAAREAEELPLPTQVNIDFLRGITKESEAELLGRAFIEKNFEAPNASYVYVQKWRDGCVVEMQEGGGYAYLPEVLAKLDEDEDAVVALPMSGRMLQVRIDKETGTLEAVLLATAQEPPEDAFIALPTAKMSAFDRRGTKVFAAGVGLLAASTIALGFAVAGLFIDTEAWALPYLEQTAVKDLPSAQMENISQALVGADCIAKMEFAQGQWRVVRGWDSGAGYCSSSAQPAVSEETNAGANELPLSGPQEAGVAAEPGQPAAFGPPIPGGM